MRTRTWIVLLLALSSGLIAGYAALELISNRPAQNTPEAPRSQFQVVVAARDLPVGQILGPDDLRLVNWPAEVVPEGYAQQIPDVIGRGITGPIRTNEPVLLSKLADRGAGGGLPILIPEGMRAVSVRVDDVIAVAGFVGPGTRVDVMLTLQPPGSSEFQTRTVLQNLEVAARGQQYIQDPQGNPVTVTVVTLYVTPEQAEHITLATKQGAITLALRNQLDVREVRTPGSRISRLLALAGPAPTSTTRARPVPASTERRGNTLEIIRGAQRSIVRLGGTGGGNQ